MVLSIICTLSGSARLKERPEECPLRIRDQTANHDRLGKSELEPLFARRVNLLCQQDLESAVFKYD
jgi:hypothetical protein